MKLHKYPYLNKIPPLPNRITRPSGLQFFEIVNRMGGASGSHFKKKNTNQTISSGSQPSRSKNPQIRRRQPPKSQISYSNHQYHLLIANKHRPKLSPLC